MSEKTITASPKQEQDALFKKAFRASLIAHALLLSFSLISSLISSKNPKILQSAVRVDLVGLPDIKKADLSKYLPAEEEVKEKKSAPTKEKTGEKEEKKKPDADEMALKKEKPLDKRKNLRSAIDRIKSLQDMEDSVSKDKSEMAKTKAKGNILSKGSSLIGDRSDTFNEYADKMKARLVSNWDLPVWLAKQNLSARVVLNLDRMGNVISTVFVKESGNRQFDGYVLKAVRQAQPFGPPPDEILDSGVTIGFPL